ncbi:MAG: hypothetical protein ACFCVA_13985 [Gammaproteobacteria bacterium]
MKSSSPLNGSRASAYMFSITTRRDSAGRVMVVGKPTRRRADVLVNIPLCRATRERLNEKLVGSLAMGTSALIEWALEELTRQGITLEAGAQT